MELYCVLAFVVVIYLMRKFFHQFFKKLHKLHKQESYVIINTYLHLGYKSRLSNLSHNIGSRGADFLHANMSSLPLIKRNLMIKTPEWASVCIYAHMYNLNKHTNLQ